MSNGTNRNLIPSTDEVSVIATMAKAAAESKYFEKLGGQAGLLSIGLYARELGLPPMACIFGGMRSVQGKVEISPQMMNAMIRRAGHELKITDSSNTICTIKGIRKDTNEEYSCSFTIEDSKRAGIFKEGSGWTKYPADMLFARCISRLARRLFPDVIGTCYVEGEISGEEPDRMQEAEVEVVELTLQDLADKLLQAFRIEEASYVLPFLQYCESWAKDKKKLVGYVEGWLNDEKKFMESFAKFVEKKKKESSNSS